jgi:hypothetical protein
MLGVSHAYTTLSAYPSPGAIEVHMQLIHTIPPGSESLGAEYPCTGGRGRGVGKEPPLGNISQKFLHVRFI